MSYCEQDLASLLENMQTPFSEAQVRRADDHMIKTSLHDLGGSWNLFNSHNLILPWLASSLVYSGEMHNPPAAARAGVSPPQLHHTQVSDSWVHVFPHTFGSIPKLCTIFNIKGEIFCLDFWKSGVIGVKHVRRSSWVQAIRRTVCFLHFHWTCRSLYIRKPSSLLTFVLIKAVPESL